MKSFSEVGLKATNTGGIVVVGFPKCGTTALMETFDQSSNCKVLKRGKHGYETRWPAIKNMPRLDVVGKLVVHKFSSYIFNPVAIRYISDIIKPDVAVLCIRHPQKSLLSWHRMHQEIARTGRLPDHFAYKEREFYANCTISEYYDRFAADRLKYDRYFDGLLGLIDPKKVVVVSQGRMAQDIHSVAHFIENFAIYGSGSFVATASLPKHVGYADSLEQKMHPVVGDRLDRTWFNLLEKVRDSGVHYLLTESEVEK